MGVAEYMVIGVVSCLGLGFVLSVITVFYKVTKHKKNKNEQLVKIIKAAEHAEAERLQKKEDEALARAIQVADEASESDDSSELEDKVPLPKRLVVNRLPNEEEMSERSPKPHIRGPSLR